MDKKYIIYKHTNKINNKIYIGQTCQKPEYRWNHGEGYKNSPRFYSAIQCYGWDNFQHEILFQNLSAEKANQLEMELIKKYKSSEEKFGYNSDSGGKNKIPNLETKIKQSISAQNKPIVTEKTKQKLSLIGKGLTRSEETKQKIKESSYLREQNKKEQGIKRERKVICLNNRIIFSSCKAAANWCGLQGTSGIALVCQNKKQKTAGIHPITKEKLKWLYFDNELLFQDYFILKLYDILEYANHYYDDKPCGDLIEDTKDFFFQLLQEKLDKNINKKPLIEFSDFIKTINNFYGCNTIEEKNKIIQKIESIIMGD